MNVFSAMNDAEWAIFWQQVDAELERTGYTQIASELLPDAAAMVDNSEDDASEVLRGDLPPPKNDYAKFVASYAAREVASDENDEVFCARVGS